MEYIVPSLRITMEMGMDDVEALEKRLSLLLHLEEDLFINGFHQQVAKDQQKAWHDHHIKKKQFAEGYLVLLYDSKFIKHPGKLQMHQLSPYLVRSIHSRGAVQLQQLDGIVLPKLINGIRLNPYRTRPEPHTTLGAVKKQIFCYKEARRDPGERLGKDKVVSDNQSTTCDSCKAKGWSNQVINASS